ncbi:UV radiation resistance protein [Helicobacter pylori]|uniref:UV radiation resistance protein n=1 Tax=Helicobacter pylori TaxID=210 RepID=UPI001FD01AA6|nr:UV radiation resistance protein [Helicobacter pylori]UOS09371.1 UV radiation resistance protein [Helicobacter pylori]
MSWIDIAVGSGSSGSGSSNNLLSGFINSLGNALNASASGGIRGFPWQVGNQNDQIVGYYDDPAGYYRVIKKFLAQKNYNSNKRLKSAFERIINIQNRINQLNHEINAKQNAINSLNNETHQLNQEINKQQEALNNLNQEIASLNNEITTNANQINQEQEQLNALELQANAKKEIAESLKQLEKLKQELKRLKKQSKWKTQFNFLTDNPPNVQAQQESALNRSSNKNGLMNFFLTNPYAILPKGFIYEYHNPGKETYNALNAPNNMDGINNQFRTNALNQVLDNSYQKFLPGNDSYNALGDIEQVEALKFYNLVINHASQSDKLESALFFKQIAQYAKGLKLKILTGKSTKKDLAKIKELESRINQEEEKLNAKGLNALEQENALKLNAKGLNALEQENALKLKESIKAKQNHTETLKNAINQKENEKNPIEQQKQNLESQRNEKEREKQNQENAKRNLEQERNNLNNEINAIGNERLTFKQLGSEDFLGIQPFLNYNGYGRTYARASFRDTNKSIREYYEIETKIKNILGFYRIGETEERLLRRFLELPPYQQNELALLLLQ